MAVSERLLHADAENDEVGFHAFHDLGYFAMIGAHVGTDGIGRNKHDMIESLIQFRGDSVRAPAGLEKIKKFHIAGFCPVDVE